MNGCPSQEFAQGRDLPSITLLHPIYSRSVQSAEGGKAELESEINRLKLVEADGKTYEGIVESARDAMEKLKRENVLLSIQKKFIVDIILVTIKF